MVYYGSDYTLTIFSGNKKLYSVYGTESSVSDVSQYVENNGYKTQEVADKLWIVAIVICIILTIISIIRCIKKLRIYIKKNKGKE